MYSITVGFSPTLYCFVDPMLLPLGNPIKCHEDVLSLQPMIPPKRLTYFSPCVGCSEGLDALGFFFKKHMQAILLSSIFGFVMAHDLTIKGINFAHVARPLPESSTDIFAPQDLSLESLVGCWSPSK